ncbi:DUF2851 family protein [Sphingobacterium sp. Lzh-3]|uniref:DUF2851 family protein n=1 Tax=unclassified Sphingobacterium TaxID=2609468 RepID=UPI002954CEE5|nr:DUF2851 family protein [Sphingobacterium sp. UGAL515B_05]WON92926.1 DUF2851 family protein [Sphingobacterium sp. UGAL515B_05]
MLVTENLMQFIWKLRLFRANGLNSTDGEPLAVVHVGQYNTDSGPDFLMSHIRYKGDDWFGHVEMHIQSSDWDRHGHQEDVAYNNVILHVVWKNDKVSFRNDGTSIPTLVLSEYVEKHLLERYSAMMNTKSSIPCEFQLGSIDLFKKSMWLSTLAIERLEMKVQQMLVILKQFNTDWEKTLWVWICRCMGLKVNADTFQELGEKLPWSILQKYRSNLFKIEALFFGISRLLIQGQESEYMERLVGEFEYQKHIHGIETIYGVWKRMRMRPYNFPERRITQLALLFSKNELGVAKILAVDDLEAARKLFKIESPGDYLGGYLSFGTKTKVKTSLRLGKETIDTLVINVIIVFLFSYGKYFSIQSYMDKALDLLEQLPAEKNVVVRQFAQYDWPVQSALQSQGILQLKRFYCDRKRCLHCSIGTEILKRN